MVTFNARSRVDLVVSVYREHGDVRANVGCGCLVGRVKEAVSSAMLRQAVDEPVHVVEGNAKELLDEESQSAMEAS
jgi:hypothetical protein